MEFVEVVKKRRSVRKFEKVAVPESVIREALQHALIAPNSSNMQPWEFYWVRSPQKKAGIVRACFSQPAAATAAEIVVAVARRDTWKRNRNLMLEALGKLPYVPKSADDYYKKIVPLMYIQGPFGILGILKGIIFSLLGLFKPVPRGPYSPTELNTILIKTTSLACENFMLSIVNQGYGCCPMEGFDEVRIKRVLGLGRTTRVVMCISAGVPHEKGVYGPQIRFDETLFVKEV